MTKIFVTGHKGYLGKLFVEDFGNQYDVVGFDAADGQDLLDFDRLKSAMEGCDQVIHIAAIPKPVPAKSFADYFSVNVEGTKNVVKAATEHGIKRITFASSTGLYGIEHGIPFSSPIEESQQFVSQYLKADQLTCSESALSYHMSKVLAEQVLAWYGLNKKIEVICLRFGPIGKVHLGTSVSEQNATQAINLSLKSQSEFWYEVFSIVDEIDHISIRKARDMLGYSPGEAVYSDNNIHSTFEERAQL